jgi:hypothetical protein
MAHFAKIGMNGKVLQVLTLDNQNMLNADGIEDEKVGQQYLEQHNNWPSQMWIQTSYNTYSGQHKNGGTPFRGNYAGIGYIWNEDDQIFWPKKPYTSWIKDFSTASWKSPVGDAPELTQEQKDNNLYYQWNEENQSWNLTNY